MRRVLPVAVAAAALCFSQLPANAAPSAGDTVTARTAATAKAAVAKPVRTPFALSGFAFGSRVTGGSLPAGSDTTSIQRISCTNQAGRMVTNVLADQKIPGLGRAEGVTTRVWTEKKGNTVSTYSSHKIAKLVIAESALGSLEVEGLTSLSRAFNANGRYGTNVDTKIARIVLRLAGAPAQVLQIPTPGQALVIPGLLKIAVGPTSRKVTGASAEQNASVLDVTVIPSKTRVLVARTTARIIGGIKQGIFRGFSAGVQARGLADNLQIGRQPLQDMPCQGTSSKQQGLSVAKVSLGDVGSVAGVSAAQVTTNKPTIATATNAGRVAEASLLGGRIKIRGVLAVATVTRNRGKITRSSKGSTIAEITIDGKPYSIPKVGKLEIPGLLRLDDQVVTRLANGLQVIGLQVTLLEGSGAVIDLGVANVGINQGVKPKAKARRR